jgi:hypothetical protein
MYYLLTPLDQHFDLGFGAVANSFKNAGDSVLSPQKGLPAVDSHLPASFLYRHSIELFLKSGIIIFHRKFKLPFDNQPFDSEPKVRVRDKWKPMYNVHDIQDLYAYFRYLISSQKSYLETHTRTDWSFPEELDEWITKIESTDSTSTFFRYPVTKHGEKDKDKSIHKEGDFEDMIATIDKGNKPLKAFLILDSNDEIVKAFHYDNELAKSMATILSKTADLLYGCHAAMRGELTGGF